MYCHKTYLLRYIKFERLEIRFICYFGQFPCSWIRFRLPNTDLIQESKINADPDPKQCCELRNTAANTGKTCYPSGLIIHFPSLCEYGRSRRSTVQKTGRALDREY
jgi:hypothetical protein